MRIRPNKTSETAGNDRNPTDSFLHRASDGLNLDVQWFSCSVARPAGSLGFSFVGNGVSAGVAGTAVSLLIAVIS